MMVVLCRECLHGDYCANASGEEKVCEYFENKVKWFEVYSRFG